MSDEETRVQGRARVAERFVRRCQDAGLVKGRGKTDDAALARLCDWLGYMSDENLDTLAETVIDCAGGAQGRDWPAEATIRHWAGGLQKRPVTEHRIVNSWLASIEGPPAVAGGYEVELFWLLRRIAPRPPSPYDMRQVRVDATENAGKTRRIRERIERGSAAAEDRQWLEAYLRTREEVRQIVNDGATRRAQADKEGAAA